MARRRRLVALAALDDPAQRVAQLRQLEQLPVQQLQQLTEAPAERLPLLLVALQPALQVAQPGLQRLVHRLRVLKTETTTVTFNVIPPVGSTRRRLSLLLFTNKAYGGELLIATDGREALATIC